MKKFFVLLGAITLSLMVTAIAGAAIISVNPQNSDQTLLSSFDLTILGSEFIDGTAGGGVGISWDPAILSLNSATPLFPGDQFFGSTGTIDNSAGTLTGFSVSSFTGTASAAFDIATLNFTAIGLGSSMIDLMLGGFDVWATFDGMSDANPTFVDGSVNVNAVPIPGSLLLLGSGLVGLVGIGRRRKS